MAGLTLQLVRHPPPVVAPGTCYGRLDVPAQGIDHVAARLRGMLRPGLPVWSSPLQRCRGLAERLHPAPRFDDRLQEMSFGAWEGQAWQDVPRAALDAWAADVAGFVPPGGESASAMLARALAWVAECGTGEMIAVTHGGVIRVLVAHWLGMTPSEWPTLTLPHGSLTTVEMDGALVSVECLGR